MTGFSGHKGGTCLGCQVKSDRAPMIDHSENENQLVAASYLRDADKRQGSIEFEIGSVSDDNQNRHENVRVANLGDESVPGG